MKEKKQERRTKWGLRRKETTQEAFATDADERLMQTIEGLMFRSYQDSSLVLVHEVVVVVVVVAVDHVRRVKHKSESLPRNMKCCHDSTAPCWLQPPLADCMQVRDAKIENKTVLYQDYM